MDAVFFVLADQPIVPDFVLERMLQQFYEEKEMIIVSSQYDGALGHPILIDISLLKG